MAYRIQFSTIRSFCQWYYVPPRLLAKVHTRLRKIQGRWYNASSGGAPFWGEEFGFQTCRFCHFQWTWNSFTAVFSSRLQTYSQWLWLSSGGCEIHITETCSFASIKIQLDSGTELRWTKTSGGGGGGGGGFNCGCIIITWYQWLSTPEESGPSTFWEDKRNTCHPLATSCWWSWRSWIQVWVIGTTVELAQTT